MTTSAAATQIDDQAQVAEMLDKQAIHEVMLKYLRGADRLDEALVEGAYHPDAVDEHGGFSWRGAGIGHEIVSRVREMFTSTFHLLGNHLILVRGDRAESEAYVLGYYTATDDQGEYLLVRALRYVDVFERRDGGWKIIHRRLIREWDRIDRNQERPEDRPYYDAHRDKRDISYEVVGSA